MFSVIAKWAIWKEDSSRRKRIHPIARTNTKVWRQLWAQPCFVVFVAQLSCLQKYITDSDYSFDQYFLQKGSVGTPFKGERRFGCVQPEKWYEHQYTMRIVGHREMREYIANQRRLQLQLFGSLEEVPLLFLHKRFMIAEQVKSHIFFAISLVNSSNQSMCDLNSPGRDSPIKLIQKPFKRPCSVQ